MAKAQITLGEMTGGGSDISGYTVANDQVDNKSKTFSDLVVGEKYVILAFYTAGYTGTWNAYNNILTPSNGSMTVIGNIFTSNKNVWGTYFLLEPADTSVTISSSTSSWFANLIKPIHE